MTARITIGLDLPEHARMLRAIRKRRGWTQHRLAQALGVSERTVTNWERTTTEPHPNRMQAIRSLLNDPPDTLDTLILSLTSLELDETCGNLTHPQRMALASALHRAAGAVLSHMSVLADLSLSA